MVAQWVESWTRNQQVVGSTKSYAGQKLRNNLEQVVLTYVPLSPSIYLGTSQGAVMLCGWEGNRRPGG